MLTIKVLGPGCANCKRLEQIVRQAVEQTKLEAQIVKVTDYNDFLAYDLLSTPGLVINEKLVSAGRIPAPLTVVNWLKEAQAGEGGRA